MIDHFSKFASYGFMYEAFQSIDTQSLMAGVFMRRVPTETQVNVVQLHVVLWNERKENQVSNALTQTSQEHISIYSSNYWLR